MTGHALEIRDARDDDAAEIAAIYAPHVQGSAVSFEETPPDAAEMLARLRRVRERHPWLVAVRDGRIAGYAYAAEFRTRWAYRFTVETSVYVAPDAIGSGVGRTLMLELIARLRALGFHRAVAGATLPNDASARLHESLGFTFVGRFREVGRKLGAWHDVGFWELALSTGAGDGPVA